MRKITIIFAMLAIALSGCSVVNSIFGITELPGAGRLLSVDANSHFKDDMEYHRDGVVLIMKKDGTFEQSNYYNTSDAAAPTQDWGFKGSYTYDPKTFKLTVQVTSNYEDVNGTLQWQPIASGITQTRTSEVFFTARTFGEVYRADGSSWTYTEGETQTDANDPTAGYVYASKDTIKVAAGKDGFLETQRGTVTPTGQSLITTRIAEIKGDAELFPAGVTFEKGNNVTVRVKQTVNTDQRYNWNTEQMDPVQNNWLNWRTYDFAVMDGYLVDNPWTAARGMD